MFKRVHKVIQVVVILPVLLCAFNSIKAQIYFKNPSFEAPPPGFHAVPDWTYHSYGIVLIPGVLMDKSLWGGVIINCAPAYNGLTYVNLGGG